MQATSRVWKSWGAFLLLSVIGLTALWKWPVAAESVEEQASIDESESRSQSVALSDSKRAAAGIQCEICRRMPRREQRRISGRTTYDETRFVLVRSPVDAVVEKVVVKPGNIVQPGDVLALLVSSEVGEARSDVLQHQAEFALNSREAEWESLVTKNVETLIESLKSRPKLTTLEDSFEEKLLGDYREKVLSAYSKFLLAETLSNQIQPLAEQGVAEGRVVRERISNRQVTEAAFRAACEQSLFDARQKRDASRAKADDAQRRLHVSRQRLATLLGHDDEVIATDPGTLSKFELRSPLGGTVEERRTANMERVQQADPLFVVANISKLWVEGDLREKDWDVLSLKAGDSIEVQLPALPGQRLQAEVSYLGRKVDASSHALSLVAELPNDTGRLRPGMFARMLAPIGEPVEMLLVPESAILEQDRARFVFVEEKPGSYRRVDVTTGRQTGEFVEVKEGLSGGESVVCRGAHLLKAELLLEAED